MNLRVAAVLWLLAGGSGPAEGTASAKGTASALAEKEALLETRVRSLERKAQFDFDAHRSADFVMEEEEEKTEEELEAEAEEEKAAEEDVEAFEEAAAAFPPEARGDYFAGPANAQALLHAAENAQKKRA